MKVRALGTLPLNFAPVKSKPGCYKVRVVKRGQLDDDVSSKGQCHALVYDATTQETLV